MTAAGGASWPDAAMRVSDAERSQVADRLSRHYAEGRLDDAEFEARLDRAMRATTRADLLGLFADLPERGPDIGPPAGPLSRPDRRRQRHLLRIQLERQQLMLRQERREHRRLQRELRWQSLRPLSVVLLVLALALLLGTVVRELFTVWVLLAILVIIWLSRSRRGPGSR
jgi:hypothetical protein